MSFDVQVTQDHNVSTADSASDVEIILDDELEVIEVPEQGPPGTSGEQGEDGEDGNTVLYGITDPAGTTGVDGNFYINTTTHFLFGPKAGDTWPAGVSMIGPQGARGPGMLYGVGAPGAGVGFDGDFYIDTATNFLYGPKAAGAWPAGTSLIGPQGPQGIPGPQGIQGPVGPAGAPGPVAEAPIDGGQYARKDAAWTPVVPPVGTVRYDAAQTLTAPQQTQARSNTDSAKTAHAHVKADITDFAHTHAGTDVSRQMSIDADAIGLKLLNDVAAPGNSKTYGTTAAGVRGWKDDPSGGRERLLANRSYFVRTDGNNANTGLVNSGAGAFLTIQKAVDVIATLDLNGFLVTIQVAAGVYAGTVTLKNCVGAAQYPQIVGAGVTTVISTPSLAITAPYLYTPWQLYSVKIETTSGGAIGVTGPATLLLMSDITFGSVGGSHIAVSEGTVKINGNYSIVGGAGSYHYSVNNGGYIENVGWFIGLTGTPAFNRFASVSMGGILECTLSTFGGAATGTRYYVQNNGMINTNGGGPSFFPGDLAGGTASGGQYS